jgi:hypothetical protein
MKEECFSCHGYQEPCRASGDFSPYGDADDECINYISAREDKKRIERGEFKDIRNRKELALYLINNGQIRLSLRVLPNE